MGGHRPGGGNNIGSGNINIGQIGNNNNNVVAGGNWGGWHGGHWGPGWGGGWGAPYYGNWYHGGWGGSGFWAGYGMGALTSFGLGGLYGGYAYPYGSYAVYNYFPTWGASAMTTWGLDPLAASYTNPYYVAADNAQGVYDYSQPLDVAAPAPDEATSASASQIFDTAREVFRTGNYARALALADQALKETPNVPIVHEFCALCLFALKRYDEAASVVHTALSAGPGWNWSTMVGLYPNLDTYMRQFRALESYVKSHPKSAGAQFLIGYHYLTQDQPEAARSSFEAASMLSGGDPMAEGFAKLLAARDEANARSDGRPAASEAGEQTSLGETPQAGPPPAALVGSWRAKPAEGVTVSLDLTADGEFTWKVDNRGKTQQLQGQAAFADDVLQLAQGEGGEPLAGKVDTTTKGKLVFQPFGAPKEQALVFTR